MGRLFLCHHPKGAHGPLTTDFLLGTGAGNLTTLEADSTAIVPVNPVVSHAKAKMIVQNPRLSQLFTLARELGYALSPLDALRRELSFSISTRLVTRLGIDVYQTAAYNLPLFPREAALQIFPDALKTRDQPSVVTWRLETCADVVSTLAPILRLSERCAGVSRALLKPSENVIRVIATLMPGIEISYVKKSGLDRLFVNFMYILSDQAGELHPPKDNDRLEIGMSDDLTREMREQVLLYVGTMAAMKLPLSAAYYRQLGYDSWAMQTEAIEVQEAAILAAGAAAHAIKVQQAVVAGRKAPIQKVTKRQREEFEVEAIVAERSGKRPYLVRWAGYHASWEEWRVTGEVGDPVETWEMMRAVKDTEALQQWRQLPSSSGSSSGA